MATYDIISNLQNILAALGGGAGTKTSAASLSVTPASNAVFPVSATALPLPTGAATEATIAALLAQTPAPQRHSYRAGFANHAGYATPTDLVGIRGSATKTIAVHGITLALMATAGSVQRTDWVKRSTANTGGTRSNPTALPYDSTSPAATAVVDLYTAAPTTGTLAGILQTVAASTGSTGGTFGSFLFSPTIVTANDLRRPAILNGINESIYFNFRGAALPAGFNIEYGFIEWTEY
jgi:hypothetical protein